MSKAWKTIFISLAVIFTLHLIRDIFQTVGVHNSIVDFLHRPHQWCKPHCNYVTFLPELFIIISSIVVLKRDKIGRLGFTVLVSLVFWPLAVLLP
jgi:hypothetical protein